MRRHLLAAAEPDSVRDDDSIDCNQHDPLGAPRTRATAPNWSPQGGAEPYGAAGDGGEELGGSVGGESGGDPGGW